MKWYPAANVFQHCELRQLEDYYTEFKKYKLLSEITDASPLYQYKKLFIRISVDQSFERFYLTFLKAYCDKIHDHKDKLKKEYINMNDFIRDDT